MQNGDFMRISARIVCHLLVSSCLFCLPLTAKQTLEQNIKKDIKTGNNDHLQRLLQTKSGGKVQLRTLRKIALKQHSKALLRAIKATKNTDLQNLGITRREFLAISHFIQTSTDGYTTHYRKQDTGLSHTVEYDADTKKYFIVLEGKGVYLDRGAKKTVSKALCYSRNGATVVARAEQTMEMDKELYYTRLLQGKPGLFKTLGICHHKKAGIQYHTIYSKLYEPGSLQAIFKNNYNLTLYEKARIALGISRGLNTLHSKGIVHRDLGIKNYLITIPEGKPGKRKINACIADFGRTEPASETVPSARLQGNTTYMAPEGHRFENLTEGDHYKIDVFAVGCVFYRLFYEKKAPWQDTNYVIKDPRPIDVRQAEHKTRVITDTATRRFFLGSKTKRTPKQEFEYTILRMLDTNPDTRINAAELHAAIKEIFTRVK